MVFKYFTFEAESLVMYIAGPVFGLSLGLYFKAIGLGPLSEIIPIWATQAVFVAIYSVALFYLPVFSKLAFLGEPINVYKVAGALLLPIMAWCVTRPV